MKAAIIKIILQLLSDKKTRHRILLIIASVVVGLFGMLAMPVVVIYTMGQMEPPEITISEIALKSASEGSIIFLIDSIRAVIPA